MTSHVIPRGPSATTTAATTTTAFAFRPPRYSWLIASFKCIVRTAPSRRHVAVVVVVPLVVVTHRAILQVVSRSLVYSARRSSSPSLTSDSTRRRSLLLLWPLLLWRLRLRATWGDPHYLGLDAT